MFWFQSHGELFACTCAVVAVFAILAVLAVVVGARC